MVSNFFNDNGTKLTTTNFRKSVVMSLTEISRSTRAVFIENLNKKKEAVTITNTTISDPVHVLLRLKEDKRLTCFFYLNKSTSTGKTERIKYGCPVCKVGFCKVRNCFSYFHSLSSTKNVKQYLISNNEQKDNPCVSIEENFQLDHTGTNEQDIDILMNDSTEDFDNLFNKNKNKKSIMRKIVGKMGGQGNPSKGDETIECITEQDLANDTQEAWGEELEINHCEDKSDDEDDVEDQIRMRKEYEDNMAYIFHEE